VSHLYLIFVLITLPLSDTETLLAVGLAASTFWILVEVSNRAIIQIVDRA
jgi:hypothetical protein